jgi:hypothetical protein
MTTQLYKRLKDGTTLYVLPGAAEDLSASFNNANVEMKFSKYVLLRIPRRRVPLSNSGTKSVFDIENSDQFRQASNYTPPTTMGDALVESLRNYVANQEATIRNTQFTPGTYLYNTDELGTVSERIFWKWLRKAGALEFEPAQPNAEWLPADPKFAPANPTQLNYLQEYLWRERQVSDYLLAAVAPIVRNGAYITVQLSRSTNFKPGDYVVFNGLTDGLGKHDAYVCQVHDVQSSPNKVNDVVFFPWESGRNLPLPVANAVPTLTLDYEPVVKFVGEITASNAVAGPDTSYSEVWAHLPNQCGATPSVMFKSVSDTNYRPNMEYPAPGQIMPEIQGADNANSPINTHPSDYPGDQYAHFDTEDLTYQTATGDVARRSGDYYGINVGSRNDIPFTNDPSRSLGWPQFDGRSLDGVQLHFDLEDYLQATDSGSFSEFSASSVDGDAPSDFEFNAILWFYDLRDVVGGVERNATNLYGIEFLDNPDREDSDATTREIVPVMKKRVANGQQDGTANTFSLNITFQVDSEDSPMAYDADRVYSLFGFELYNEAMARLAMLTDVYYRTLTQVVNQRQDITDLQGLVYGQQSLDSLRLRMTNIESLLVSYSTAQIGPSESVIPRIDASVNPPVVRLDVIGFGDTATTIELLKTKVEALITQLKALTTSVTGSTGSSSGISTQITGINANLTGLTARVTALEGALAARGAAIAAESAARANAITNLQSQITLLQNQVNVPAGAIVMWTKPSSIPAGWKVCDGTENTPDLRGQFVVGYDANDPDYSTVGNKGGEKRHTLTIDEMPAHNHANGNYNQVMRISPGGDNTNDNYDTSPGEPDIFHTSAMQQAGGSQPHENRPPYYVVVWIQRKS